MVRSQRLVQHLSTEVPSRFCSVGDSVTDLRYLGNMVWECIWQLPVALLIMASPRELLADNCVSSSASGVSLWTSSLRNLTGHWITKATLIRKSRRDISELRFEPRPLHYYIGITRQSCGDVEKLTTVFTVVEPPARVGADYKFFPNVGYYKLHTLQTNWENARRTCAKEGAHLAVVNSEAEENAIREVMRAHSKNRFDAFIGFHDMFKEGQYLTVLGHPLRSSGHVNWKKGEPNNVELPDSPEGEDCGTIYNDGTINDVSCNAERLFVCEQSL
ncbi:hemolymph lipopolysaccharide-binding protein-like [Schistocerca gregaria]|uniref:hemolymph lipopolysaccharide-binding protein-like n=1 Tax=Schistocerca gregaria TaxID=7010 RepID=UPI00211E3104|nr:hemolymph lipopolysaccharide-binding protein-like [Schistocerca gregaria]